MENNKVNLKIIFIGTPEFGAIILEELIKNNYQPVLVITNPDKPVGRRKILTPPAVKLVSQKYKIHLEQPVRIKNLELRIRNLKPDLIICAAYGQIIPKEILGIPKYGCLNVHPSLLPKYRGASPIQAAILNGDKKTGVTIMLMDEKMDHGPILAQRELEIPTTKITYKKLHNKLAEIGAGLLIKTIPDWVNGKIKPKIQDEKMVIYTKIIKKEDGRINWKKPAQEIERQIRAFNPWPGAFTFIQKKGKKIRIKICQAEASKDNKLIIKKLQPEGKKPMNFEDFKKGYKENIF